MITTSSEVVVRVNDTAISPIAYTHALVVMHDGCVLLQPFVVAIDSCGFIEFTREICGTYEVYFYGQNNPDNLDPDLATLIYYEKIKFTFCDCAEVE